MFGFRRSAFETEGWVECGGGLPVPRERIDRSSVRCSNYPYPRCKNLWQARVTQRIRQRVEMGLRAGVQHKHDFQCVLNYRA
ncbi:hypothetical protein MKW98_023494 [Papaver atlanticum]|uniref:CUB domain-containing protein n=1 Tax=Papaver atlanticum TaxID=357466 RepID=A0AAD4XMT8_9MAGN|nr:hypothetical protein MKW98_023494 [Papaver atlanticum]